MAVRRKTANKRPSMFEVAKLAGVSHQTVSRVINHSPDVSDATRERVQKAIDELGYRPSNSARALASRRSRTIGLIAGGQRFYGPISAISAIESMARSHGLFMSVSMVHEALCTQGDFDDLCRTFDRALAVGGGAARNAPRAAFRAPDRTMLHDDMRHLAGLFIASGQ